MAYMVLSLVANWISISSQSLSLNNIYLIPAYLYMSLHLLSILTPISNRHTFCFTKYLIFDTPIVKFLALANNIWWTRRNCQKITNAIFPSLLAFKLEINEVESTSRDAALVWGLKPGRKMKNVFLKGAGLVLRAKNSNNLTLRLVQLKRCQNRAKVQYTSKKLFELNLWNRSFWEHFIKLLLEKVWSVSSHKEEKKF